MKSSRLARQSHASEESLRVKLPILVEIGGSWRKQVGPFYKSARLKGPEEVAYPYLSACRKVSSSSPRPTASILVTPSTLLRISQSRIPTEYQTYACLMNLPHPFTVSSHIPLIPLRHLIRQRKVILEQIDESVVRFCWSSTIPYDQSSGEDERFRSFDCFGKRCW